MGRISMRLQSGSSIIFEGLDKTGKSTQIEMLRAALDPASTVFAAHAVGVRAFHEARLRRP